jgi:hypothetical protein
MYKELQRFSMSSFFVHKNIESTPARLQDYLDSSQRCKSRPFTVDPSHARVLELQVLRLVATVLILWLTRVSLTNLQARGTLNLDL